MEFLMINTPQCTEYTKTEQFCYFTFCKKQSCSTCSNWKNILVWKRDNETQHQNCCDLGFKTVGYILFDVFFYIQNVTDYWKLCCTVSKFTGLCPQQLWFWNDICFATKFSGNKIRRMTLGIWSFGVWCHVEKIR
jgi:hypothetical protein